MLTRKPERAAPPYVSYRVFCSFLAGLHLGVEQEVERVVRDTRLGCRTSAQLLTALKFLGLVSPLGKPTATLYDLGYAGGRWRQRLLAGILKTRYSAVFNLLPSASNEEFQQAFRVAFGTRGVTTRKSMTFLLHAAADAGLAVSDNLVKRRWTHVSAVGQTSLSASGHLGERSEGSFIPGAGVTQDLSGLDPALKGLLLSLPPREKMDRNTTEACMRLVKAVFDLVYSTKEEVAARQEPQTRTTLRESPVLGTNWQHIVAPTAMVS